MKAPDKAPVRRSAHYRCQHGMIANVCIIGSCEHYDGLSMDSCQRKYVSGGFRKRALKAREKELFNDD